MEILSGEQMRAADRHAIETLGIPSLDLMEAAGAGIARAILDAGVADGGRPVRILCGKGNNGGDGLVVARHLARAGLAVEAGVLAEVATLSPDAAVNLERARQASVPVECLTDEAAWDAWQSRLAAETLIVDALLGTGIHGAVRGLVARAIHDVLRRGFEVHAIDVPSGVDADSGLLAGPAIRARVTYTLCRPKPALIFAPAADCSGDWRVVPIGIPDAAIERQRSDLHWTDAASLAGLLGPRPRAAHKGRLGHVLVVAGSPGRAGAAVLAARGALRGGAGLVTVACPQSIRAEVAVQQAELMTEPLIETGEGRLGRGAVARVTDLLESRDVLALGPGLGTDPETVATVHELALRVSRTVVLDADGLNALALDPAGAATLRGAAGPRILTPHPGEAARLLGVTTQEVQTDRLRTVRDLAERTGAIVVLKGDRTLVAAGDGVVAVNPTGNPGMATAGSGDVLTGLVAALAARGLGADDAARLAVFVHGDAGDRAAAAVGQDAMIASDLVGELGPALRARVAGGA